MPLSSALTLLPSNDRVVHKPTLPMDVIYEIIGHLVRPPNEDCFTYESPRIIQTIASLCLVCKDINFWSTPHLYSRITIEWNGYWSGIISSPVQRGVAIRSLVLGDPIMHICIKGIVELFQSVATTLERVMLLNPSVEITRTLLRRPVSLPALKDVVYANYTNRGHKISAALSRMWPNVRRLAIIGGYIDIGRYFPNLEVLVLNTYKADLEEVTRIVSRHPALRRVVIVTPNATCRFIGSSGQSMGRVANRHRGRISFIDVHRKQSSPCSTYDWIIEQAQKGLLWNLEGRDWLSLYDDGSSRVEG